MEGGVLFSQGEGEKKRKTVEPFLKQSGEMLPIDPLQLFVADVD